MFWGAIEGAGVGDAARGDVAEVCHLAAAGDGEVVQEAPLVAECGEGGRAGRGQRSRSFARCGCCRFCGRGGSGRAGRWGWWVLRKARRWWLRNSLPWPFAFGSGALRSTWMLWSGRGVVRGGARGRWRWPRRRGSNRGRGRRGPAGIWAASEALLSEHLLGARRMWWGRRIRYIVEALMHVSSAASAVRSFLVLALAWRAFVLGM